MISTWFSSIGLHLHRALIAQGSSHGSFRASVVCGGHRRAKSPVAGKKSGFAPWFAGSHPSSHLGSHPLSVLQSQFMEARLV